MKIKRKEVRKVKEYKELLNYKEIPAILRYKECHCKGNKEIIYIVESKEYRFCLDCCGIVKKE